MNIIPIKSKYFRNEFIKLLFNDTDLLNAINVGETLYLNKTFNKRLFSK